MRSPSGSLALALALAAALAACRAGEPAPAAESLLLITVDTLRADTLGFAGDPRVATPHLDHLAAGGRVFSFAHAHNVVTLPSHANILTGLYPYQHGVRENAGFTLPAGVPTLATLLAEQGFATAAFVAAYPVARHTGLARGFEVYDDDFGTPGFGSFEYTQRPGDRVVAPALVWWRREEGRRRFLWVHLFDPHWPYEPAPPHAARHPQDPYLGEVETTDAHLGPLLGPFLDGGEPPTLVVLTSDHGEALGAHGESTHGVFAYEETLKVPLVLWGPGIEPGVDPRPAGHVDLLPTALAVLGVEPPAAQPELPGRSLLAPPPETPPAFYFEALSPHLNLGWAPLRGTLAARAKWISLPEPELYDLAADPRESRNLAAERPREARRLDGLLPRESRWPPPREEIGAEEARRLAALGYLAARAPERTTWGPGDDPKRLIGLRERLDESFRLARQGRLDEAIAATRALLAERPDMPTVYSYLTTFQLQGGDPEGALETMLEAHRRGLAQPDLARQLGLSLVTAGRPGEALQVLEPLAEELDDAETLISLALARSAGGDLAGAERTLARALERDPLSARGHETLAFVLLESGRFEEAAAAAGRAVELDPGRADAWNNLGIARFNLDDPAGARDAFGRALDVAPGRLDAGFYLALAALEEGDRQAARRALEAVVAAPGEAFERERRLAAGILAELSGGPQPVEPR